MQVIPKLIAQILNYYLKFFFFLIFTGSEVKASAWNAGDPGLIPGSGRSPGEGNGNPLQYSGLENPMDRGAWRATVHRVAKSWTQLSDFSLLLSESIYLFFLLQGNNSTIHLVFLKFF